MPSFSSSSPLRDRTGLRAAGAALRDLGRDLRRILPDGPGAEITVRLDPALTAPESYELRIGPDGAEVAGADELGAVYGVYRFSREFLGVDPLWFWKDLYPLPRTGLLSLPEQTLRSVPAAFALRGWFVNDEDLLTEWREPGGARNIRYPYYAAVIAADTAEAVYEAALRCGANLIIPASFLDIDNPPEAKLVELAVERGLFVSQHHIEPLGVSHFTFENYRAARGKKAEFAYGSDPEAVRECWRHYAGRWRDVAGDKVVWQLGLRGCGDRAVWQSDGTVSRETAGAFISRALKEQVAIIRETDPRPRPPMTLTLWAEMSGLMAEGALSLPPEIMPVFSDFGPTQEMQSDFLDIPREKLGAGRGAYLHIALWIHGPHLHAGVSPAHVERVFREVAGRGDTAYAVINVCNIREHVIGIESAMEMMRSPADFSQERFLRSFAGEYAPLYREYFRSFHAVPGNRLLQDGDITRINEEPAPSSARLIGICAERFRAVAEAVPGDAPEFIRINLAAQSRLMGRLYSYAAAVASGNLPEALAQLDAYLVERRVMEQGKWVNWYRGDRKCAWPQKRKQLAERLSVEGGMK